MDEKNSLLVEYGFSDKYTSITQKVLKLCIFGQRLKIPTNDCKRADIFGDPLPGILKNIRITINEETTVYNHDEKIDIIIPHSNDKSHVELSLDDARRRLIVIHDDIKLIGGDMSEEYPEQLMSVMYINPHSKVLELGSNIGRNTLTIASVLLNDENLVTLECDSNTCKTLESNKHLNKKNFFIENSALSYKQLIQKGWNTIPSEDVPPGFVKINSVTYQQLEDKYQIKFDTLVADCEGALYYILQDCPDILNNIHTIILENDFPNLDHKCFVDGILKKKNFIRKFVEKGGLGVCIDFFYEVWTRKKI